jgi:ubiquinone/menaquinone biosynthesis C-methylase UbiE
MNPIQAMTGPIMEASDDLDEFLVQVANIFDINRIIGEHQEKPQIARYYSLNRFTYRLSYSWAGVMHCGISYDGKRKKQDLDEQVRTVERLMREMDATKVLELGCGLGPNSAFLARRNPRVTFDAIDLSNKPLRRFSKLSNLHFHCGDYHNLSSFEEHSYDIAFVVEALCYSTDKAKLFREVERILSNRGIFVVVDVYQSSRAAPLSLSEEIMWTLITRGVASEPFERVTDVESYMRKDFSIVEARDLTRCILPTLDRQKSLVQYYFKHPAFARAINRFFPFDVTKNAIVVFLLPVSVRKQILCYYLHVLRKAE